MSVNSSFNSKSSKTVCGLALAGLKTKFKGPALQAPEDKPDLIDEALKIYRFNVCMKSFSIKGTSDRVLVYLFVYLNYLIPELAKATNLKSALDVATKIAINPNSEIDASRKDVFMAPLLDFKQTEAATFKEYLLQLRHEIGARIAAQMFTEEGPAATFKLWTMYAKKKFMSLTYK